MPTHTLLDEASAPAHARAGADAAICAIARQRRKGADVAIICLSLSAAHERRAARRAMRVITHADIALFRHKLELSAAKDK